MVLALGTAAGLVLRHGAASWELSVLDQAARARTVQLTIVAKALSVCGSIVVLGPATAVAAAWLLLGRRRVDDAASLAAVALGVVVLVSLVKVVVDRPRPRTEHLVAVGSASFPSQHAAQAAAILPALALCARSGPPRAVALTAAVCLALAVGLSRVYLGVHYPTDVVGGWALGAAWLAVVRRSGAHPG